MSSRESSVPVSRCRGKRGKIGHRGGRPKLAARISAMLRVLTWNLFHGRSVPDVPRVTRARIRGDARRAGNGTSRCSRSARRGGREPLGRRVRRACLPRADEPQPAAAASRGRSPSAGRTSSSRGAAAATRSSCAARRRRRTRAPAAAAARAPRDARRAPGGGVWVGNVHAQAHRVGVGAGRPRRAAGRAAALGGAASRRSSAGTSTRASRSCPASPSAGGHVLDHVFVRGLTVVEPAHTLKRGTLSDHRPVRRGARRARGTLEACAATSASSTTSSRRRPRKRSTTQRFSSCARSAARTSPRRRTRRLLRGGRDDRRRDVAPARPARDERAAEGPRGRAGQGARARREALRGLSRATMRR